MELSSEVPIFPWLERFVQRISGRVLFDRNHSCHSVSNIANSNTISSNTVNSNTIEAELKRRSCAIEASMDGVAILDSNEHYIYVNKAHAEVYGYSSPNELIGQSWTVLYETSELERFKNVLMPEFQKTGKLRVRATGRKKNGALFPQEVSLTALEDGGLICVVRDITQRALAEKNVEEMALFAELNPSAVIRFDEDGYILRANPAAVEILRIPPQEKIHIKSVLGGVRDVDLKRCIQSGAIIRRTFKVGERYFHFVFRGVPHLHFGHVYGTDITDLRQLHQRLMDNKRFLRRVIDSDPNLIFVKDVKGRFTLANQALAEFYGTTVSALLWKSESEISPHIEEVRRSQAIEGQVLNLLEERTIPEEQITDANGKQHWFQTVKRPLRLQRDGEVHLLGVSTDITERKALQAELLQSQKMEAIGQLAGGIAHDFNNLLTGILGCTDLLKAMDHGLPEISKLTETIEIAATRAGELTQKLLGFARKGKHQNIPVDIHATIRETVELLSRTIEKEVLIYLKLDAEIAFILGDPVQLQQIILNLTINARDSMYSQAKGLSSGALFISTRITPVEEIKGYEAMCHGISDYIEISVKDSGCGIPAELHQKIFEPFFTTKPPDRGTGLGLSMVYGIVKNHGGSISVESDIGKGSTFKVYLPIVKMEKSVDTKVIPLRASEGRGKILVVDDHEVVRSVTAQMLGSLGYDVIIASDGKEALQIFEILSQEINLVILDMVMPHMGARECFQALKAINPGVRVVLSTGYVKNNAAQEILQEGMCGFVQKPYQLNQLAEVVSKALVGSDEGGGEEKAA